MKKYFFTLLTLSVVMTVNFLHAQADFKLQTPSYVGALSLDPSSDWTTGWTNFDPVNSAYPDPTDVSTLDGMNAALPVRGEKDLTSGNTLTLDASKVYLLPCSKNRNGINNPGKKRCRTRFLPCY